MDQWQVLNETRATLLGDGIEEARSFEARLIGLLGRAQLKPGTGLHLVPCNEIHMFFMRFPIDAVFLDAEGHVLKIYLELLPWRFTSVVRGAQSVLELPAGACQATGTQQGDRLIFRRAAVE